MDDMNGNIDINFVSLLSDKYSGMLARKKQHIHDTHIHAFATEYTGVYNLENIYWDIIRVLTDMIWTFHCIYN